jgi:hypothetical protein
LVFSTAFKEVLERQLAAFQRLFRRKAMVHHYTEFMEVRSVDVSCRDCGVQKYR